MIVLTIWICQYYHPAWIETIRYS